MIETMGDQQATIVGSRNTNTLGRRKSRPAPQPPTPNVSQQHPLERVMDELAIRNPSELVIGIAKTVATQWRHKPQNLLRPGVCYEAQVRPSLFNSPILF